jgi:hypothetical protein
MIQQCDPQDDDSLICISALAQGLIALEKEIADLEHEAVMLHRKLAHITCKQRICTSTIQKMMERAPFLYGVKK